MSRVSRLVPFLRTHVFDLMIVALAVAVQVDLGTQHDASLELHLAALGATLPLLARRPYPLAAPLVAAAFLGVSATVDPQNAYDSGVFFFAALFAAWSLGSVEDRRKALVGPPALVALDVWVNVAFPQAAAGDYFWVAAILLCTWLAGHVVSRRGAEAREARRLALEREEQARVAVDEERARIARELHDVVAHSISVMTVQAGGVRRLLHEDQRRERDALAAIEQTGREALTEMRRLLGILRGANEGTELAPQPGLERLDALAQQVREAGLPVEVSIEGEPVAVPAGLDLSAYRVVQEALTNALKHAGPARAEVRVRYEPDAIALEIANDGARVAEGGGARQGLPGMRERVAFYGGTLDAGPRAGGGGYVVRARIPLPTEHAWRSGS
jgi:signal transduction histidine kinase